MPDILSKYFKHKAHMGYKGSFKLLQKLDICGFQNSFTKSPRDYFKLLEKLDTRGPRDSKIEFKYYSRFFPNTSKTEPTWDPQDSFKLLGEQTGGLEILSNYFNNQTQGVPEILLNYFKKQIQRFRRNYERIWS